MHSNNTEALFPFIIIYTIGPNDRRIPQNQHCFSIPCLFVLITHHFKPLTKIGTNYEQIEAEAAKKLRTMSLGWFLLKKIRVDYRRRHRRT